MSTRESKRPMPWDVRFDHRVSLPVLGIPVDFESNDAAPISVADEAFGAWRVLEQAPRLISEVRVRYRIHVEPGGERTTGHAELVYRQPDPLRVIVRTLGTMGIGDAARREALLYTNPELVADRQHFRYGVLEALALAVLTRLDRMPLHAACIARGDTALLLAGPSGSGKSTLTYAAARAGYKVLSEDYVNVQLEPRLRVWGMPGFLHLPADSAALFPELAEAKPSLMANGKEKIAISIASLGALPTLPVAQRAGICVLRRTDGAPAMHTLDSKALQEELTGRLDPGFDQFPDQLDECVRLLAGHGGWKLEVGSRLEDALDCIASMFEVLAGG